MLGFKNRETASPIMEIFEGFFFKVAFLFYWLLALLFGGKVTIRDSAKTQLDVISLKLQSCPFRGSAFEWLQYFLLFLIC